MARKAKADGVEITLIAIRETLMEYFKGSCVERVTKDSNVMLQELSTGGRRTRDERWRQSFRRPNFLMIDNIPLAEINREPDTIKLHSDVLRRSPQLRTIKDGLVKFLSDYLPGVKVEDKHGSIYYG